MSELPLSRAYYPDSDTSTLQRQSRFDAINYSIPMEVIHNSALHGWGIAIGLAVHLNKDRTSVMVTPGVAIEENGSDESRHISLANQGWASTSKTKPADYNQLVKVEKPGVQLSTSENSNGSGIKYITIQFCEIEGNRTETLRRYIHTPWLRFQNPQAFSGVVLAEVELNAKGEITRLSPGPRRGLNLPAQTLQLYTTSSRPNNDTIQNANAATLAVRPAGGLDMTVTGEADEISIAAENGSFARLTLAAQKIVTTRSSDARETVTLLPEQGNITLGTESVAGSLVVTDVHGNAAVKLQEGNITASGHMSIDRSLTIRGESSLQQTRVHGLLTTDSLTTTGNTSVGGTLVVNSESSLQQAIVNGSLTVRDTLSITSTQSGIALDTGKGVFTGAASDYSKAQAAMTGGGSITWEGIDGRLGWTNRFLALSSPHSQAIPDGYISMKQPEQSIPAQYVHDEYNQQHPDRPRPRFADERGVILYRYETLYAVHEIGGGNANVHYEIVYYTENLTLPSNWLMIAEVNQDDHTIKLGIGTIIQARSSFSRGTSLPDGAVLMWSGVIKDIPYGWALCDGQNDTPDLQGRFIVGAGVGNNYDTPGWTGNTKPHSHQTTISQTKFTTDPAGKHTHAPPSPWYDKRARGGETGYDFNAIDRGSIRVDQARTGEEPNHEHGLDLSKLSVQCGSYTEEIRPKWYALCFIMKIAQKTVSYYTLVNRQTGKALAILASSLEQGAKIVQYDKRDGDNQQWQLLYGNDGYVTIINRRSQLLLNVPESSTSQGIQLDQGSSDGTFSQQWKLQDVGNGYYTIHNRKSELLMEIAGGSKENDAPIIQWTDNGGLNQHWKLVTIS